MEELTNLFEVFTQILDSNRSSLTRASLLSHEVLPAERHLDDGALSHGASCSDCSTRRFRPNPLQLSTNDISPIGGNTRSRASVG
jgi:hypothetical protein